MGNSATGELRRTATGWSAVITIEGRRRETFALSPAFTHDDELAARERCSAVAEIAVKVRKAGHVARLPRILEHAALARPGRTWEAVLDGVRSLESGGAEVARAVAVPTFETFAEEWTSGRLHAKYPDHVRLKNSDDDASRIRLYIHEHLGSLPLDQLTLADCNRVMASLPKRLRPSTRRQIAQIVARVMKLAKWPGGYIKESPVPSGWLPQTGKAKARGYIYPDEDALVMACTARDEHGEPRVPLWRRLLWGFMAREGTRGPSEALSFRWRHLDLERGAVRLDANKTDDPRVWSLTEGTVRALLAWRELTEADAEPGNLVFVDEGGCQPHVTTFADRFREDLKTAGVTRAELFERNEHRLQIRAHDLRASFITVALANQRSEAWVTDRTGHTTSGQLMNYRRAARTVAELQLGDFVPLDEAIPELGSSPHHHHKGRFQRVDSNHDKRNQNPLSCH